MAEGRKYYIRVPGALVEVSGDVYFAYHQEERRARTLEEKDRRHGLTRYSGLDTAELCGEELIPDRSAPGVEEAAMANALREELYRCLAMLPRQEREILFALYFENISERKYAELLGVSQNAVHKRRYKALDELRRLMKI